MGCLTYTALSKHARGRKHSLLIPTSVTGLAHLHTANRVSGNGSVPAPAGGQSDQSRVSLVSGVSWASPTKACGLCLPHSVHRGRVPQPAGGAGAQRPWEHPCKEEGRQPAVAGGPGGRWSPPR